MKTLHYINLTFYTTVLLLYMSVYYSILGMLGQFFLGIFQIILALILFYNRNDFSAAIKRQMTLYWMMLGLNLLLILIVNTFELLHYRPINIPILFIFPMLLGAYFTRLTYQAYKYLNGHYDTQLKSYKQCNQ